MICSFSISAQMSFSFNILVNDSENENDIEKTIWKRRKKQKRQKKQKRRRKQRRRKKQKRRKEQRRRNYKMLI